MIDFLNPIYSTILIAGEKRSYFFTSAGRWNQKIQEIDKPITLQH